MVGGMTFDVFRASLSAKSPPPNLPAPLVALWHDARGDWETAHRVAQDVDDDAGAWVHAYLHRKEGDLGNAAYWYRRANKPRTVVALDAEWEEIARALLA
jgi:hypothetical protein